MEKIRKLSFNELFKELEESKKNPKFMKALNEFIKKTTQ